MVIVDKKNIEIYKTLSKEDKKVIEVYLGSDAEESSEAAKR